nr:sulfite exporter TauE/SafE family protein [Aquimarina acroporae]
MVSAFILGLLGSFHCIGMCGPIAFMLPVHKSNSAKKLFQVFLYHFGRLLAYGIIGFFFGVLGKSFHIFNLQQGLSIIIGILMILIVIVPSLQTKKHAFTRPIYRLITKVKSALGYNLQKKTTDTFLTIGFLNGFLPCGLVYMAVFGAIASSNILMGSMYMILFGLGTVPMMTIAVYTGNFITGKTRNRIQKLIPIFIVIMGILFVLRGMGLGIPYLSPEASSEIVSANFECHS